VAVARALQHAFLMLVSLQHEVVAGSKGSGGGGQVVRVVHHAEWCATLNTALGALQLLLCVAVALMSLVHRFPVVAVRPLAARSPWLS